VLARYGFVAIVVTLLASILFLFRYPTDNIRIFQPWRLNPAPPNYFDIINGTASHPIDSLIEEARKAHDALLLKRSHDVASAAAHYRERRGRHPPPGFDKWVEYAVKTEAVIVEDFFDRIYHDVSPFWGLEPNTTALQAASWPWIVRVREGNVTGVGDVAGRVPWLELWTDLVAEAADFLPDVDMPINYMDESRLLVPWEDITKYVAEEKAGRTIPPTNRVIKEYSGLKHIDAAEKVGEPRWYHELNRYWDLARAGCPPDSPSRNVPALEDCSLPPQFPYNYNPAYSYKGYVRNFTASSDPCFQPHLRAFHGTFVEPVSMATATELIPLFGGSKLPMNNEILIPGAMYLTKDPFYSGGETHGPPWDQKKGGVVWRGAASGGRNKKDNWTHFQRHRLVEMLNGTTVANLERNGARAMTFELPPLEKYDFPRRRESKMGEWLSQTADAAFVNLLCSGDSHCDYVSPYFSEKEGIQMKDQYVQKFIPDADGNSFSARFRGLLLSTSLPLKATIYSEWHDDRLMPWLHFAPLDNTFQDLYGVLDYFTRDGKGDAAAKLIAESGKAWGEKVLRREDMLLYTWRVLLEFARVCDEKRDKLAYVEDLLNAPA
jgi:hypothetical protein